VGLSGSQQAYRQARAGIERADASRAGYYTYNHVVTINGTNRSSLVLFESLRVTLNRNDEPDDAEFTLRPNPGFTPTAGQEVKVCLGAAGNPIFAGQIGQIRRPRVLGEPYPFHHISCQDWTRLFNRRRITRDFSGESATDIAIAIVEEYTSGFTTYAIEPSLATMDEFICVNEPPMTALTRLANELGGGCFVDARKIVHLWDSSGPSSNYTPTPPVQLTTSLSTLKQFTPHYDFSQVRTRVIVEGKADRVVWPIPVGADVATYGIPLGPNWTAFNESTDADANYVRFGTVVATYDHLEPLPTPLVAVFNIDASPGDTSIEVLQAGGGTTPLSVPAWLTDGSGNYFYAAGPVVPIGPHDVITGIPASGYGSIPLEFETGAPVYQAPSLADVTVLAAITEDVPVGADLIVRAQKNDSAAQTAIAAIEGGDGIHEHFVSDSSLSYAGCAARAQAELDLFSDTLLRASWNTYDMRAMPGGEQSINITGTDTVSATLLIDSVTLTFPIPHHQPLRTCEGSTVKLATILDAIKG
jgi:hypothetical protein